MHVNVREAENKLLSLIDKALNGEKIIIWKDDTEAVQLTPKLSQKKQRSFPFGIMPDIKTSEDLDDFDDELAEMFGMIAD